MNNASVNLPNYWTVYFCRMSRAIAPRMLSTHGPVRPSKLLSSLMT